jgi:hypothetical protein
MRRISTMLSIALLSSVIGVAAQAQSTKDLGTGRGGSQHVSTAWTVDGAHVTIAYGRPALKGRPEATLMPPGKPWRTGADAATVITSDKPLTFGKVTLPAGTHTINTVPGDKSWELIFGKLEKEGQWGVPYQPALEIGRVPMTLRKLSAPVEQVTLRVDRAGGGHALLVEWGAASASAPFTIGK